MVEHQDLLGVGHRRQPVRNHQGGAVFGDFLQLRLDRLFGLRIERRRRFVEDQDGRVLQQGAGDGHALLFATRQLQAPLAHHGVVAIWQAFNKIMDRCRFRRRHDGVLAGTGLAVGDVVFDGVVEQDRVLRHDADGGAQRVLRDGPQILAIDGDAAAIDFIKTEQQARQGRLARAAVAHHGRRGAGRNLEIHVEQDLPLGFIAEIHMIETHGRAPRDERFGFRRIGDFAVFVQQGKQAFHVGQALLDFAVNDAEEIEGDVQLDHEGVHQHQVAQGHAAVDHAHRGAPQDQGDGRGDDQGLARIEQGQGSLRFHGRRFIALQAFVVALRLVILVAEIFHGFIVDQRIDGLGIRLRVEVVHGAAEMRAPVRHQDGKRDVGHQRHRRDHGKPDVVMQDQIAEHEGDFHQRRQDVEQGIGNERADAARAPFDIARHAARLAVQVKAQGQGMQVAEHLQRDGAHGPLRHPGEQEFAQFRKQGGRQAQQAIRHQQADRQHQQRLRMRRRDRHGVDEFFQDQGHAHVGQLGAHQA